MPMMLAILSVIPLNGFDGSLGAGVFKSLEPLLGALGF